MAAFSGGEKGVGLSRSNNPIRTGPRDSAGESTRARTRSTRRRTNLPCRRRSQSSWTDTGGDHCDVHDRPQGKLDPRPIRPLGESRPAIGVRNPPECAPKRHTRHSLERVIRRGERSWKGFGSGLLPTRPNRPGAVGTRSDRKLASESIPYIEPKRIFDPHSKFRPRPGLSCSLARADPRCTVRNRTCRASAPWRTGSTRLRFRRRRPVLSAGGAWPPRCPGGRRGSARRSNRAAAPGRRHPCRSPEPRCAPPPN